MKFFNLFVVLIAAWALSACGIITDSGDATPRDTATRSQFLTLVTEDNYDDGDNQGKTWGWAYEDSLVEVERGDDLVFIFGYLRGTYRVELKEWNWNEDDDEVSVSGLPLSFDYDEGDTERVHTFRWTPSHNGEYHFSLWLSDQSGRPRAGSPIELTVVVGDHGDTDNPDDGESDPELSELVRWFNVTLDGGRDEVGDGDRIDPRGGDGGISVNWSVDSSTDEIDLTVTSRGREIYHSSSRSNTRWIAFDEIEDSDVVVRLRIEEDGRSYTRTIRFEVRPDGTSTADRGTITFSFFVPSGYSTGDVRMRITDSRGYLVGYADNGDRFELREGHYEATLVEKNDFEINYTTRDCSRGSSAEVNFRVEDNEDFRCSVYFEEVDDADEFCEDAVAHVIYDRDCFQHGLIVTRSGPDFRMEWDLSTGYDRHYVQLYRVGVGDVYQSTARSGSRTVDPSNLEPGVYEFRVTGYDSSGADLWWVVIYVQ